MLAVTLCTYVHSIRSHDANTGWFVCCPFLWWDVVYGADKQVTVLATEIILLSGPELTDRGICEGVLFTTSCGMYISSVQGSAQENLSGGLNCCAVCCIRIFYMCSSETCKNCIHQILKGAGLLNHCWPIEPLLTSVGRTLSVHATIARQFSDWLLLYLHTVLHQYGI